jgi:glycosyltransferase involved in cell wall biosynthesis
MSAPIPPRVSILIPNYNNGRESSIDGATDLLGDLLRSLEETLREEVTPFEVIVYDDGSTDDSLATAREWAGKTWAGPEALTLPSPPGPGNGRGFQREALTLPSPGGRGFQSARPFLRLIERPHGGVLSVNANHLHRAARGEICVRLDGDIVCLTPRWVSEVCRVFDGGMPSLGVIGPKQLGVDGRIHAAGDWILHPRGYHHIAQGASRESVMCSMEVDHVMGCFYCYKRKVWEDVGGFDESILRGQTIDFGLGARLKGWRTFFVPTIEFVHRHGLRRPRTTKADTDAGVKETLDRFEVKWGFSRLAPDLDVIREKYAGTPLLWNARWFGPRVAVKAASDQTIGMDQTEWGRFAKDPVFQEEFRHRMKVIGCMNRMRKPGPGIGSGPGGVGSTSGGGMRVLHVECRAGLFCHLLAKEGVVCAGVDADERYVAFARAVARREKYPVRQPEFAVQREPATWPFEGGSFDAVVMLDLVERHANPVRLFREAHRVLGPGGILGIVTRKRRSVIDDEDGLHCFRAHELDLLLRGTGLFSTLDVSAMCGTPHLVVMLAARKGEQAITPVRGEDMACARSRGGVEANRPSEEVSITIE